MHMLFALSETAPKTAFRAAFVAPRSEPGAIAADMAAVSTVRAGHRHGRGWVDG